MMVFLSKLWNKYIAILLFAGLWELVSRLGIVNRMFIPSLSEVIRTTWDLFRNGILLTHIAISLERALSGFFAAAVIGISIGFLVGGWFKRLEIALEPLLDVFSQTNPFILFHIIFFFLGFGDAAKIAIIAWTCTWPIVASTISGIHHMDPVLLKAARSFGLGRWDSFRKVVLPAVSPSLLTGLRLSLGYSLFMLIAAEMMGSDSGLGWLVINSQEGYQIQKIFSAALIIALLGYILDTLLLKIGGIFIHFEREDTLNSIS